MMYYRSLSTLLIWLSSAAFAGDVLSDSEGLRQLERMSRAPASTTFQGVYMQQHGDYMETIRICHVVEAGVVSERRETLDGPPREMLRQGGQVSVFLPEGARLQSFDPRVNNRMFPRLLPDNPAEVLVNYTVRRGARERVAGVETDIFDLEPRDRLRYPHRFWVHVDTGLLLKAATYNLKREIIDLYTFSQLVMGSQVDKNQLKSTHPVRLVLIESGPIPVSQWEAKGLPNGFRLTQQTQRVMHERGLPAIHHLYSDGLATVSVFLEQMQINPALGPARQGTLSIFSRQENGFRVTALGEVPVGTVELFAKAYKPIEKQMQK